MGRGGPDLTAVSTGGKVRPIKTARARSPQRRRPPAPPTPPPARCPAPPPARPAGRAHARPPRASRTHARPPRAGLWPAARLAGAPPAAAPRRRSPLGSQVHFKI